MTPATLEDARRVLPLWVIWLPLAGPLVAALVGYALASLGAALAARGLRRLPADAHWTERARLVFPVRRVLLTTAVFAAVLAPFVSIGGPVSVGAGVARSLTLAAAIAAVLAAAFRAEDRFVRRIPTRTRVRSFAAWILLFVSGYLATLVMVILDAPSLERLGALGWFAVCAVASIGLTFGGGLLLARASGSLGPAPERVRAALARVLPAGAKPPRLYQIAILSANAIALPWLGAVVFTDGALERLDDAQLDAVLAHELAHLREPRPV